MLLAAVDVHYRGEGATAGCVTFEAWTDAAPRSEHVAQLSPAAEYVPGEFWKRELPCVLAVLQQVKPPPDVVLIDGHVWLDSAGRKGLGARLHEALGGQVAVIGVAKSRFADGAAQHQVFRGGSRQALYVSAVGIDEDEAVAAVRAMHGEHRIPTLLKRVDRLCREAS